MRFHTQATNRLVMGGNRSVPKLDGYLKFFDRFDKFYDGSVNLYDSAETIQKTKNVVPHFTRKTPYHLLKNLQEYQVNTKNFTTPFKTSF